MSDANSAAASASWRVESVEDLPGLDARAADWNALAARCARPGLLSATHAWFASFVEHRLHDERWICLFAYQDETLRGVLPLARRRHRLLGARRPWLWVPNDVHATGGDVLLDAERAGPAWAALVDAAFATRPRPIGLVLGGLGAGSPTLDLLATQRGAWIDDEDLAGRSIPLDGTWEAWHARLGNNLRRNLRKARNRLARAGELSFRHDPEPEQLARFLELEASGWKGRAGGDVEHQPDLLGFYRALCARLAASGALTWHFLELDDRPLAGALEIRYGAQVVLQRVAFDEGEKRLSPGHVLLAELLERWFAEGGLARVDCLTDQPWHETWCMERTPYSTARVPGPGPLARLAGTLPARARARLKRWGFLRRLVRRLRGEGEA